MPGASLMTPHATWWRGDPVNTGLVILLVVLAIAAPAAVAPAAMATHSCGFEPCPHVEDVFCLTIVKKFLPQLCPYG
jgi:hypothetical protein